MTADVARPSAETQPTHRPATSVLLHLVPGAAALAGYLVLLPVTETIGLPSAAALAGASSWLTPTVFLPSPRTTSAS